MRYLVDLLIIFKADTAFLSNISYQEACIEGYAWKVGDGDASAFAEKIAHVSPKMYGG